jgi:tetratricopeptide (TPR) repeat protein
VTGGRGAWLASALSWLLAAGPVAAEPPAPVPASGADGAEATFREQLRALAAASLLPAEGGSVGELRALVALGERLYLERRYDEAAVVLMEAVESPRHADFGDFEEMAAAEHMLGGALYRLGSLLTARRYLKRAIERGVDSPYHGPAVRRYSDVALALGDAAEAAVWLEGREPELSDDARDELRYLRGRALYDAGELQRASRVFSSVTRTSRFYASARYLMGVAAARGKRYPAAERRFCEIADTGVDARYSFFVDDRFFQVQDLARLGLGRVAHEMGRADDAFYYYFQVPQDSPRLAEAFFEGAYAAYEGGDHDTAVDLLDQLEARFPRTPFADEASILRGYVSLGRCDFERADRLFERFLQHFEPILEELSRLRGNAARRRGLYEQLRASRQGREPASRTRRTILSLISVDPEFHRLHARIASLEAEMARAGRVEATLALILARLQGGERPRVTADPRRQATARLSLGIARARRAARAAAGELDVVRRAGADGEEVAALERELSGLADRVEDLHDRLADVHAARAREAVREQPSGEGALIAADLRRGQRLMERAEAVRQRLLRVADRHAEVAVGELHDRLARWVGRARLGRIDAVMGSKRRIERQIESLAAGRFPPELRDPLRVQGLLADDEEYWPYEGEDWPDEYEERGGGIDESLLGEEAAGEGAR